MPGKTEAMLRAVLKAATTEFVRSETVMVIAATSEHRKQMMERLAAMAADEGHQNHVVHDDTLDIHGGRRVYFATVDGAREMSLGMWPGKRFLDHFAEEKLVDRFMAGVSGEWVRSPTPPDKGAA